MFNGLVDSINSGCNVIDTCRNFRGGRSEQIIGSTLSYLIKQQGYSRNNFFIGSKAGYVRENLPKSVSASEIINDHCVHPEFLKAELDRSLASLKLSTIDVYYLNNFA
jgi:aryl-alcohol dehydrogenase-like predicted oxidoreductase